MTLKSSIKRLEKELAFRTPSDFIIYGPETDERGFISVKHNGKITKYISPHEHERQMHEMIAAGKLVCGPGWERWYERDDGSEN